VSVWNTKIAGRVKKKTTCRPEGEKKATRSRLRDQKERENSPLEQNRKQYPERERKVGKKAG